MKYTILTGTLSELENLVNNFLVEGWEVNGTIILTGTTTLTGVKEYAQAMILKEEE